MPVAANPIMMKKTKLGACIVTCALLIHASAFAMQPDDPENREGKITSTETGSQSPDIAQSDIEQALEADSTVARRGLFRKIGDYFKDSNEDKTLTKKFDFSIIGGPHYTSDIQFGLGVVAAGLFRTDRTDTITKPSNVSLFGDVATSGFWLLGISGNTFFDHAKYRLDYTMSFFSMPSKFWGIGYEEGRNDDNESKYKRLQTTVKADFLYRIANNTYAGVNAKMNYIVGKDFHNPGLLRGQDERYTNTGLGVLLVYDSRDYVTAPHKGWFVKLENLYYPYFTGNKNEFNLTELTVDYYHRVWEGGILAYDLHGEYNHGNVPWTMLARMGGSKRMRGYYEGRSRDKGLAEFQVELRQRIWRRIGGVVWGGAGNVFESFSSFDLSQTLPNYGVGFRWEFKKRVNVRLDFGMGKGQTGFIFGINEAF